MSKRLQVVMDEAEYRELQEVAESKGLTLAAWVREALRRACRREATGNVAERIEAVRAAAKHSFPTVDIDRMLAEIESGYLSEDPE
jgi:hypothetical protein